MPHLLTVLVRVHQWAKAPLRRATRRMRRAGDARAAQELDYIATQFEQMSGDTAAAQELRRLATARRSLVP